MSVAQPEVENKLRETVEQVWQSLCGPLDDRTGKDLLRLLDAVNGGAIAVDIERVLAARSSAADTFDPQLIAVLKGRLEQLRSSLVPPPLSDLASDPELLNDFLLESQDYLAGVEAHLLAIENNRGDLESVHAVFRAFHTIKGLAGFLGFNEIQSVAHETENILDQAREGRLAITPAVVDIVLRSADYLSDCLKRLSRAGGTRIAFAPEDALVSAIRAAGIQSTPEATASFESEAVVEASQEKQSAKTVKVDAAKIEYLADMIGELVIAQSIVGHHPLLRDGANPGLARNLAQLARVTEEVQRTAMSMRMVPVGRLFGKMERLIRDLSRKSGKRIQFRMAGDQAELDRNIVEELADPLVHMIRNAVDHGLELPDERIQNGKPAEGKICMQAHHEGGCIVIQLSDDGRGLNRERILAKAIERRLISAGTSLTDEETFRLIFHPGFSTAEKVTDLSGRGVGMDVVSRNIQKLRGRIEIQSTPGEGCTFTLRLPLTLAIIDGLVVRVGEERYIVPIFAMKEMFPSKAEERFIIEGANEMVLFRGSLFPIVSLRERFSIPGVYDQPSVLILIQGRNREFCLEVDQLVGKQEVVIKNLGSCFQDIPGMAGGAILGDGKVGLILDVDSLFTR